MDIYRKYVWVIPLKDKKDIIITNSLQKVLNDLGLKSNRIWVKEFTKKNLRKRVAKEKPKRI